MAKLIIELGDKRLSIDTDKITLRKVKELAEALADVRAKYSIFSKYPMEEGESLTDYQVRVQGEVIKKNSRKEGESDIDFQRRLFQSTESQSQTVDELHAIAAAFGQGDKVSEESCSDVTYVTLKNYLNDILAFCDLDE